MNHEEFQLRAIGDPRLAIHATSALPVWLWSMDGTRVNWANAVGTEVFGALSLPELREKVFGPADPHRRQVAQLAGRLPPEGAIRLERLRGFGAPLGALVTCACTQQEFPDGEHGILIAVAEPARRTIPLTERLQRLVEHLDRPVAAFTPDGNLVACTRAVRPLFGFGDLSEAGLDEARRTALALGRAESWIGTGQVVLMRVGTGADVGLVAWFTERPTAAAPPQMAEAEGLIAESEQASMSSGAPDEFTAMQAIGEPEEMTAAPAEMPDNVVPFRPTSDTKSPALSAVENNAFAELARQLSRRLGNDNGEREAILEVPADPEMGKPAAPALEWLAQAEPPAQGDVRRDRALLDLLPSGVLIYRLDRLLYANPVFLKRMAYASLQELEAAGGLDALYVELGAAGAGGTLDAGTPVRISSGQATPEQTNEAGIEARLHTISWDDAPALALILSAERPAVVAPATAPSVESETSALGHADAEELAAILDMTADGILMCDDGGNINACNRSAEALFGYEGDDLATRNLRELFAPESQPLVLDYVESAKGAGVASLLDHGRELLGRTNGGGLIPLSITIGRTRTGGPNFFAVFRDLSQVKKTEGELRQARRLANRAAEAKADVVGRISHELRSPLNAIIGFAELMVGEQLGPLGNERYIEYLKDIRSSGERVLAIINDLLDLSRIETGKLQLALASQDLNEIVEQCVARMQPQANRERIIIRSSLAHALPPVLADPRALRQITLNLIANSIHLADAGGQVIVSTALSDFGEVVLRVRDTGHGLNRDEVAAAMEPFRTQPAPDQAPGSSGVSLSLAKALTEANRAQFHIKTGPHPGTLIEVVFSHAMTRG